MVRSGYPVYSAHVDEDPFLPFRNAASLEGIKCILTLPILFQGDLIGIMRLLTRTNRSFTTEEISFAMALAEQVGLAISHGRMFREMKAQLTFLHEIAGLSSLVNSTLDLETILRTMVERMAGTLGAKGCTLRLLNPETNSLELAAACGVSTEYLQRGGVENERNIQMVLAGAPVAIYDVSHDQRIDYQQQMADEGIVSLLAVPLKVDEEIIGVLRILTDVPRVFTDTEVQFAVTFAEVGGTAIRNARNYRKIKLLLAQIEEHEKFLNDIINSLQHQLLVLNRERRVVLANRVFLKAMGKAEEEVLGMNYGELCSSAGGSISCPVDQILAGKNMKPFVQEIESDDQPHWFERTASSLYGADGQVEYVIEIIRDITSEHLLEEEKVQSGKLQGIIELAGTIAHEINSPLFAALGTAQLLVEDVGQPEVVEELAVIIRNLQQISELTKKMATMTGFTSREYVGQSRILSLTNKKGKSPDRLKEV
jgi:PAS domain S-box-containing protein